MIKITASIDGMSVNIFSFVVKDFVLLFVVLGLDTWFHEKQRREKAEISGGCQYKEKML